MPQGLRYTSYRRRNRIAAPLVEMTLMTETPLHWLTISELSQRIRHGALSPVELTEHLLSRLEALDGTLHAFKLVARERCPGPGPGRGVGPEGWPGCRPFARDSL